MGASPEDIKDHLNSIDHSLSDTYLQVVFVAGTGNKYHLPSGTILHQFTRLPFDWPMFRNVMRIAVLFFQL